MSKFLIFIPTYNEIENVEKLYKEIKERSIESDILFLDDNSPDGTGQLLDRLSREDPQMHVIHRSGKEGIGSAHKTGICWAYDNRYTHLITMDSDFSHSPDYISVFVEALDDDDIVVGSRYMKKNSLRGWSVFRKALTHLGHFLTKTLLGLPYDATGAYRLYRLENIPQDIFELVRSNGYSFLFESLFILQVNGFKIKEVPIHLPARTYGHSKMRLIDAIQSVLRLIKSCFKLRLAKKTLLLQRRNYKEISAFAPKAESYAGGDGLNAAQVEQDWDKYWRKKKGSSGKVYDFIASIYRNVIIKPSLNHFIQETFDPGAYLLHAGCGSGQVDADLSRIYKISALDISRPALEIYKQYNPNAYEVIHGDIFRIPAEDNNFDGIYNLGVMEHFHEEEIILILNEFKRVLKPGGKMVLFWPPEFGISVRFLDAIHFILNRIFKKNIQLHPPEITRVSSKRQIQILCEQEELKMIQYYFGIKDMFTQAVVILQKEKSRLDNGQRREEDKKINKFSDERMSNERHAS